MYSDTAPKLGDTDNVLYGKICESLNTQNSGNFPPRLGDSDNNLLFKIARLLNGN
jgi:hypothetical protein